MSCSYSASSADTCSSKLGSSALLAIAITPAFMLTATAWKGYKSLIRQYFRTIAEPRAEVNRANSLVLGCGGDEMALHSRPQMSGVRHIPPGQAGIPAFFGFPLEWAEKVESAVARCDWPQPGQAIASPL